MDNPETLATQRQDTEQINVRDKQRGNQEWTILINWQHRHKTQNKNTLEITKGQSRMDNPETLATLGTQDTGHTVGSKQTLEKTEGAIKNGQSRNTGNIGYTRDRTYRRQ